MEIHSTSVDKTWGLGMERGVDRALVAEQWLWAERPAQTIAPASPQ